MKKILFILFVLIPCTVIGEIVVPMEKQENGLYLIPCKVNGVPMKFIFDTGASTVNISMTEALFLYKNGHIQESDIKGTSHAQIANGEIVENTRILLHKIDIGGIEINDVDATVSHNLNAPLLLGQSAINRLGMIQLDGTNLIIKESKNIEGQNDNISILFHFSIIVLIIAIVGYLIYIVFSKFKEHHDISETNSRLSWFESRKYIIYISYCLLLLLSVLVLEQYINNKRDKLFFELRTILQNSFGDIDETIYALDFNRIDDIEYEEVSIPTYVVNDKYKKLFPKQEKINRKQWNNKFSGIEHVYKITDQGWQMAGMQYALIPNKDRYVKEGIQEYYFFPFMICVPNGLEFNKEIAKEIIEKSLDKVYCEPDQYNNAAKIKLTQNEYFHFTGNRFFQDSLPELCMHFYDEVTGTAPIYDNNKFTGYYWFGMHKIGQYRVIFAYTNSTAWRIEEKNGFSASTKDRAICYSITFILLTTFLLLFLYCVNHSSRKGSDINVKCQLCHETKD